MGANKAPSQDAPVDELSYEDAFSALEDLIAQLENEKHALDQSMALFERGQALAKRCASLLEQAELKIQQLTENGLQSFEA
jgi:exodeoxyribonuclease VII small subunit